MLLKLET